MTRKELSEKLKKILESMIGENVVHCSFGLGTIVGFEEGKCVVKYNRYKENKRINMDLFFDYHEPVSQIRTNEVNALKDEYIKTRDPEDRYEKIVDGVKVEVSTKVPNPKRKITFDDVIGLDDVKELINQMAVYPFKYQDLYKRFKRDSGGGILLYGAPGTGKTMIAKAIANEIDAKFYSIKCSDIAAKYFGESEQKIKDLFEDARKQPKSIIFFDEFDSIGTNRDRDDSHSINMMVSELLAQIDGFDDRNNTTLLIASTNKPWNIDSALLRSGRFNKKIYIGLPNMESRRDLFMHELKNVPTKDIDYDAIANKTDGYSSADIVELCNDAKDKAIKRSIEKNEISEIIQDDLLDATTRITSTIVKQELDRLENFKVK